MPRAMRLFVLLSGACLVAAACVDFDDLVAARSASGVVVGDVILRGVSQAGPLPAQNVLELGPPPGTAEGDFMILAVFNDRQSPDSALEVDGGANFGWRSLLRLKTRCSEASGGDTGFTVYTKNAMAGEGPVLVQYNRQSDPADNSSAVLSVWGGVDPVAPIDVTMSSAPDLALEAPSVTTTGPGRVLLTIFTNKHGEGALWLPPPNMTQNASTGHIALFTELVPNAGETGPRFAQTSRPICGSSAVSIALRPTGR